MAVFSATGTTIIGIPNDTDDGNLRLGQRLKAVDGVLAVGHGLLIGKTIDAKQALPVTLNSPSPSFYRRANF